MGKFFCGWYFRCQSDHQTVAIIASYHKAGNCNSCEIQIITDTDSFHVQFPYSHFKKAKHLVTIGNSCFRPDGIRLDVHDNKFSAYGNLRFGPLTTIQYDIMGPFRFLPLMQCRHSVYSMYHSVNGEITVNGNTYSFRDGFGYIEGDQGRSFPKDYMWTQYSFTDGALMLSTADIPVVGFHFTGVIGIVYLHGKEYRLATYLGAKAIKIAPDEIIVRQGSYTLHIKPKKIAGHPLRAPVSGNMQRTIHEHPSCCVSYVFERDGSILFDLHAENAALEYEY